MQGCLLHQLERGLVNTTAVKTDRLAQLLLLPGLNLPGRVGQSPTITEPPSSQIRSFDPEQPSQPQPRSCNMQWTVTAPLDH